MQRWVCVLWVLCCSLSVMAFGYSGGSGDPNDPYQIATAQDLIDLGNDPNDYDKHFVLTADIDLDPNLPGGRVFNRAVIAPGHAYWEKGGHVFIGKGFSGCFDGQGYTVRNLHIQGEDTLGLFGGLLKEGLITRLGLETVHVTGKGGFISSLVAQNQGHITSSYSSGAVIGNGYNIGGLVGVNGGQITSSFSSGSVSGGFGVGGLVGGNYGGNPGGNIIYSYSSGDVNGEDYVGGLVGGNAGHITSSNSSADVSGDHYYVGGLAGNNSGGKITSSYSSGAVIGDERVGGLVGDNSGEIASSYSSGAVSGEERVGGLVGINDSVTDSGGNIISSYSSGSVIGDEKVGGLVGINSGGRIISSYSSGSIGVDGHFRYLGGLVGKNDNGTIQLSFWNTDTSGLIFSNGGTGLTTAQMQDINTYLNAGWDFVNETANGTSNFWQLQPGTYPELAVFNAIIPPEPTGLGTLENPYRITDANELGSIWYRPYAHYQLTNDINLSGITFSCAVVPWFYGSFDGNSHVIKHLTIQGAGYLGLFGQLKTGGSLSNIGLQEVAIEGMNYVVGSLVGSNRGRIASCYSIGSVSGDWSVGGLVGVNDRTHLIGFNNGLITSSYSSGSASGDKNVGGLVGLNYGNIISNYSTGIVTGDERVGGLVGHNYKGTITSSYSTGIVTGDKKVGGLVGPSYEGTITSSFWDTETSGQTGGAGGTGLPTAEMQDINTFLNAGWDFVEETFNGTDDIWFMPMADYPRLWVFEEPNVATP